MSASEAFAHPEFLVETAALERQLGDPDLRILDCTTHLIPDPKTTYQVVSGRADFEKRHTRSSWMCKVIFRTRTTTSASCCLRLTRSLWR